MLSLGTEFFLAFWIASYRVGLPAGSPPPVRAATSTFLIRRAKSLPRLASMAAFLCLVVAHFEWPDIAPPLLSLCLAHQLHEAAMHAQVTGELRVEGGREQIALPNRDNPTFRNGSLRCAHRYPAEHLDGGTDPLHPGGPDEHGVERPPGYPVEGQVGLERVDLPAERVAPYRHVDPAEGLLVGAAVEDLGGQHDHAGAGAVRGHPVGDPFADGVSEPEVDRQLADRGGLPAGYHQRVDVVQLARPAHRPRDRPAHLEPAQVLPNVALQGEHSNIHQPRSASRWDTGTSSTLIPTMASPSPRDTFASTSGSSKNVVALTIAAARWAGLPALKMPDPTNTPSAPSCIIIAASAGVAMPPAVNSTTGSLPPADLRPDLAHVGGRVGDVAGTGLALRADHRGALGDPAQRLAQVRRPAHERHGESPLVDVVRVVGRGQHLGLVDVVHAERLEYLRLDEVPDAGLGHHRDRHRVDDAVDQVRVGHPRHAALDPRGAGGWVLGHGGTAPRRQGWLHVDHIRAAAARRQPIANPWPAYEAGTPGSSMGSSTSK